jgi:hypothetical protein
MTISVAYAAEPLQRFWVSWMASSRCSAVHQIECLKMTDHIFETLEEDQKRVSLLLPAGARFMWSRR